jgi:hypothetical protein
VQLTPMRYFKRAGSALQGGAVGAGLLSRDSLFAQQIAISFCVQVGDGTVDSGVGRTHHGDFLRLPGCGNAQIGTPLGPGTGEIRMRQSLALVSVKQHDVAGPGLCPAQLQSQADAVDLGGDLAALQRVSRPAPAELFFAALWTAAICQSQCPHVS